MATHEYEILRYEPAFKDGILYLQTQLWGEDPSLNARYFEWKYERNPHIVGDVPIYVALHQGNVVGMRGFFAAGWQRGDRPLVYGLSAADAYVHSDHRRRGLFSEMTTIAEMGLSASAFVLILSAGPSSMSVPGYRKLGWQQIGAWQGAMHLSSTRLGESQTTMAARSTHIGQKIINRISRPLTKLLTAEQKTGVFSKFDENYRAYKKQFSPHLHVDKVAHPQVMAQLAARQTRSNQIHRVKDERYLGWRFQNPFCQYRFLFWQENELQGYLVLQQWIKRHRQQVNIVDWEFTTLHVLENLLQAARQLTEAEKIIFWGVGLPKETESQLEQSGYHLTQEDADTKGIPANDLPYRSPILLKAIGQGKVKEIWGIGEDELSKIENWNFRGIDSDYY